MNPELYEMERNKTRYSNLKENIKYAINVLSATSFKDDFSQAKKNANEGYKINGNSKVANSIESCRENVNQTLENLRKLYNLVSGELSELKEDIRIYNEEQNGNNQC